MFTLHRRPKNHHLIFTSELVGLIVRHGQASVFLSLYFTGHGGLQKALLQYVTAYDFIDRRIFALGALPRLLLNLRNLHELTIDVPNVYLLGHNGGSNSNKSVRDSVICSNRVEWTDGLLGLVRPLLPTLQKLSLSCRWLAANSPHTILNYLTVLLGSC